MDNKVHNHVNSHVGESAFLDVEAGNCKKRPEMMRDAMADAKCKETCVVELVRACSR